MNKRKKNIFDYKHVAGTTAICLLKDGEYAGRIVGNWSDNPAGTVATFTVMLVGAGPDGAYIHGTGKAGGYGYDKRSSAIYEALRNCHYITYEGTGTNMKSIKHDCPMHDKIKVEPGRGNGREAFEDAGYTWIEVC